MQPPFLTRVKQLFAKDSAKKASDGTGCLPGVPGYPAPWVDCCGSPMGAGITNMYTGLGTPRDQATQTFYGVPRLFSKWELENAFRASWIAKRIVRLPPDDMTREWRKFTVGGDDDGSRVRSIEEVEKQLQVKKRCNIALKWARLYGGALLFLGIRDDDPGEPLDVKSIGQGDLKYLLVLDRYSTNFAANDYVYDVADNYFGMPQFYTIAGDGLSYGGGQAWHNSRVVRFDGEELPLTLWRQNDRWGDSALSHVLQVVLQLESAQRACLLAMQQGSLDIVSIPDMRGFIAGDAKGIYNLHQRIRIFSDLKSIYRAAVKDVDEKFDRIAPSLGGYDNLFSQWRHEVCGACEIPHTVLYGESPSGLNATGSGDTRQYYDHISTMQENDLRPQLDYLDQVLIRSALGEWPADYSFDFKPLWQMDEDQLSQIQARKAQRDDVYVKNGVLEPEMVARQLLADDTYSTLTGEDVNLISSYNEPMSTAEPTMPATPTPTPTEAKPRMRTPGLPTGAALPSASSRELENDDYFGVSPEYRRGRWHEGSLLGE